MMPDQKMEQGYSGSTVRRVGQFVEKSSSDAEFTSNSDRQRDLLALSHRLAILPRIDRIESPLIFMEYIEGHEGLNEDNAPNAGQALRLLHAQTDYIHPCMTGVAWLIQLANENLAQSMHRLRIDEGIEAKYPPDALIHSEPVQLIQRPNGAIVFIDIEGIGVGSRYQDIGYVYYRSLIENKPDIFVHFVSGYISEEVEIERQLVLQMAGIIALAYAGFADFDMRINLGIRLFNSDFSLPG